MKPRLRFSLALLICLGALATFGCVSKTPRSARPSPAKPSPAPGAVETVVVVDLVADVRAMPEDGAELVTQALYNEEVQLLGDADGWFQVQVPDGYVGWTKATSLARFSGEESPWLGATGRVYAARAEVALRDQPRPDSTALKTVYLGTPLGVIERAEGWLAVRLAGLGRGWVATGDVLPADVNKVKATFARDVLATARTLIGRPYLWGGTSPLGYDCSGLVYEVYKVHGVKLPRDADEQFKAGRPVGPKGLRPGDLLFFSSGGEEPTHVAIFAGGDEAIEAVRSGGGVKVSSFSGLKSRRRYLGARRMAP